MFCPVPHLVHYIAKRSTAQVMLVALNEGMNATYYGYPGSPLWNVIHHRSLDYFKVLLNYGAVWDFNAKPISRWSKGEYGRLIKYLTDAGEEESASNLMQELGMSPYENKLLSLKNICRFIIRRSMAPFHIRKLCQLHLPAPLANFILLNDTFTLDYSEALKMVYPP